MKRIKPKLKINTLLIIFLLLVVVFQAIASYQRVNIRKTGLAASKIATLDDLSGAINELELRVKRSDDANDRLELGRKYFEYDLTLAEFSGVRSGNEPFLLEGDGRVGVLLIHGFSASPHEVREIAEYLNERGKITVYVPLLAGHGADYNSFGEYTWEDWYDSIQNGYRSLSYMTDDVYVGGVSLGGNLAMDISKQEDVKAVFVVGAPVFFRNKIIKTAGVLQYFLITVPNEKLSDEEKQYYYYNRSVVAIAELMEYMEHFKANLAEVDKPIFIMQSENDLTIEPMSAEYIYDHVSSKEKTIKSYPGDSHIIINKYAKKNVFKDVLDFVMDKEEELAKS